MERKYKKGQLVKLRPVPEDEKSAYGWGSDEDKFVGRIGRIVIVDDGPGTHAYYVKFHGDDEQYTHSEKYLKKAQKWEVRKYNLEKSSGKEK